MDHPNLLRAWPLGDENGRLIVALERCGHPSLTDLLRSGPLPPPVCAHVLAGAAAGADALIRLGLVARDVTPDAVFGHPELGGVLADLGIPPGLLRAPLGPDRRRPFSSPEELRNQRLDPRSTVYSLGVLLFTALTRAYPYRGSWADVRSALAAGAAPAASRAWRALPPGMDQVIARAIAPDPERRFADAGELVRVVAEHLGADVAPRSAPVHVDPPKGPRGPQARTRSRAPRRDKPRPDRARARKGRMQRGLFAAVGGLIVAVGALLMFLRAAGLRVLAQLRRLGAALLAALESAVRAAGRTVRWGVRGSAALLVGACRGIVAAGRTAASLAAVLVRAVAGVARRAGSGVRWPGATKARWPSRRRFLPVTSVALVASALTGVALGRVVEVDRGPSSVSDAGVTIQLPPGWEQLRMDPGPPAALRGFAVGPPAEWGSGLVVGRLRSQAAAERMLAEAQATDVRRTRVRLGELDAWRYAGLRPRRGLVGTGYLIPTADRAAVVICHAPKYASAFLSECGRVASTVTLSGEKAVPLPSVDESRERLTEVIAALRSSRAKGLRRLGAAARARGQVRAATSLERSHRRAAESLGRIPPLANGQSLAQWSAAVRAAADAYGRVAAAATRSNGSAYWKASRAVARAERALRDELAQASAE